MTLQRISAFCLGQTGGNPAGVVIADTLPSPQQMQSIAREVGYSETAFAAPDGDAWQVRYFSPEAEVAFCGHATIALGAALGQHRGAGHFRLTLAQGSITVDAHLAEGHWQASLRSPPTWSRPLARDLLSRLTDLFGLTTADLDPTLPPLLAHAGVQHAILTLQERSQLSAMAYPFEALRDLMQAEGLTTVSLLHITSDLAFAARNAFAIGGVVEDPATGAAAAALGGALVDLGWPALVGGGRFTIRQGEDMDQPSLLEVAVSGLPHAPVQVSGATRLIDD
ncbi:PhzF family phenazine biosynthesis protein [Pseudooceanicola spongiae]|uniref:PhzF family phenazine biosynthesis isomerase n=1 Tax=Pseudooceanicola spongiae TaxID=2613965 RepID=A0A7L9WPD7_9RHOB|nr:PhzF family phenazine biosynthesis isomerase [Pseudooceanicola spongiae]QOL82235.1 PhzF family phenazine biosynthesis isomerase [Pseudooceanicola spongiae]